MKKFFMVLAAMSLMVLSANIASAQDEQAEEAAATEQVVPAAAADDDAEIDPFNVKSEVPLHQALKTKFIEGGAGFMSLIIIFSGYFYFRFTNYFNTKFFFNNKFYSFTYNFNITYCRLF